MPGPVPLRPLRQPPTGTVELWSLREDTLVELPDDGTPDDDVVLVTRWGDLRLPDLSEALCRTVERMSYGPVSLGNAVPGFGVPGDGGGADGALLTELLDRLQHVLVRSLATDAGLPLLSVVPMSPQARFAPGVPPADAVHRLSRFASLRTDEEGLCIESPLSPLRVTLHGTRAAWLAGCFARAATARDAAELMETPVETVRAAVGYLAAAGMLVRGEPRADGTGHDFAEDRDPALLGWSPYDLMMHARSRLGRHDGPMGATYEPADRIGAEPATLRSTPLGAIPLPSPDLDQLLVRDPPVTLALEARESVRSYGERPLGLDQLGELLYRSARVRSLAAAPARDLRDPPATGRPYPSTGASYALELYPTVSSCEGLERGTYHYDPVLHSLRRVDSDPASVDELLTQAREAAGLAAEPPVLLTMTARFGRMNRKYSGFAYSALLKDVGVLQQTLYLVCTAMRLAPCALATGDSDLSARALGLDWRTESSIGEFVLGPLPPHREREPDPVVAVNGHDWRRRCAEALQHLAARAGR